MAKQTINLGTAPTGAGGNTFRSGSAKLQANDNELYAQLGANAEGVLPDALPLNKGGTGATKAAQARANLGAIGVGEYGLGASTSPQVESAWRTENGFFTFLNKTPTWDVSGVPEFQMGINCNWVDVGHAFQILAGLYGTNLLGFRTWNPHNNQWDGYRKIYHSGNTAVDSNGVIKEASPIVQLYADRIELNDDAKKQAIEFEKLGVGDYLIKGSSGFAQDGWYIETPKDANGNLLVAVVYEQLENGDISVKTYDYMLNKKGRIVADTETPLDIPESRWIDLRLQELPQPEIEIPKSVTPPDFQPTGLAQAVATVMESYHDPEQ